MINKTCPLSDKEKLDAALHGECKYQGALPKDNIFCDECVYENPTLLKRIEKDVSGYLKSFVFEPNVEEKRDHIKDNISKYLYDWHKRGRIQNYRVICDERNNLDSNRLCVEIIIRKTMSSEKMKINFIIS